MKNRLLNLFKRKNGQSIVEFALILPVLILILMGIIEFGRLLETTNILTSAAREGARVAAVSAPDVSQVNNAANNILSANNISGASITVNGPNANKEVTVTVQLSYSPLTGSFFPFLGSLQLTRSSRMHWEG
ncbi:pilus assembly protein [candidate division KSB1 bacterium]|nr:pilus assembly protein [candidate division KSB1 bacterium]